jgi:hypothetical protein
MVTVMAMAAATVRAMATAAADSAAQRGAGTITRAEAEPPV